MNEVKKIWLWIDGFWNVAKNYPWTWFVVGLLPLAWCVWVNVFPTGYIISGGDVLQLLRAHENFWPLHYEWSGRVSLFYVLFYVLDTLGISETGQLSWYLGVFLFGSYTSFYVFSRLVFPRASHFVSMLTSVFYAANVYTLYIFTSTWGYTHYQSLYLFIPALTGLFMRAIASRKTMWCCAFLLVVFLASGGSFGNPAFALSLTLYFLFLTVALLVLRRDWFVVRTVKILIVLAFSSIFLNIYWILPLVPQIRSGIAGVSASTDIVLSETLQKTSNAISDTVRLIQTGEKDIYYPYNFPYRSLSWLEGILPIVAFIPFFFVLFGMFGLREQEDRKSYFIFFSLFVVFVVLVARARFPFETMNGFLFQLPGFNVLRGYDKMAIYTPFLLITLILSVLVILQSRKKTFAMSVLVVCVYGVLIALPFYVGGLQTKMSYILARDSKKDFRSSKYSALIRIPREYYDIQSIINRDESDGKVSRLPFSEGSSVGRANLPGLKINGPVPDRLLYTRTFVDPNEIYFLHWRFGEDLENTSYDPRWITSLYGLMGIEYIVYHKDAKASSLEKTNEMMRFLEKNGSVAMISENNWLALYRIDDRHVFPYAYIGTGNMELSENVSGVLAKAPALKDRVMAMSYTRYPDKHVEAMVSHGMSIGTFVLSERYDPLWEAEFVDVSSGEARTLERDKRVTYANGWKMENTTKGGKIVVRYLPVELFYKGAWISGLTLVIVVLVFVITIIKHLNRKKATM